MSDLISRQAAIDEIDEWIKAFRENGHKESAADACLIQDGIIQLPAAQPQRMRGRWVEVTDGTRIWKVCDQCGEKPLWNEWRTDRCESNFCPNCGARMDGGEQDE